MIKSLDEIKQEIIKEKDLQLCGSSSADTDDTLVILSQLMAKYPEKIEKIEKSISNGEDFRSYFADDESLKELKELREYDIDKFYRIIHKEELFLNTCLQTFGFHNYLVSLNPDKLFGEL